MHANNWRHCAADMDRRQVSAILDNTEMTTRMRPGTRIARAWLSLALILSLADCASRQPDVENLVVGEKPTISDERAAVVADIRRKAEEARQADTGQETDVYETFGPPTESRRTFAEVKAIVAELDALAEIAESSSDPGELAVLRRRAARLEALRKQVELDGEAGSGSLAQ